MIDHHENVYQVYAWDRDGRITHAGVWKAPRATLKTAQRIERKWMRERAEHGRQFNPSARVDMIPLGDRSHGRAFNLDTRHTWTCRGRTTPGNHFI